MDILLVRHAIAVERGTPGFEDDARRPLTPEGRRKFAQAARGLAVLVTPQAVLTSPLVRARETAGLLTDVYGLGRTVICEGLADGDHDGVLAALDDSGAASCAVVGHEPWMGELLSYLLTGDPRGARVPFKKGGAALVRCDGPPRPGQATLQWLVPPGVLRRMIQGVG